MYVSLPKTKINIQILQKDLHKVMFTASKFDYIKRILKSNNRVKEVWKIVFNEQTKKT